MKLGFLPPMVTPWIVDPDYVGGLVALLEELEFESLWVGEHVVMAREYEPRYPYSADGRVPAGAPMSIPDPLEWLSFVAALGTRLVLGTSVVIAPQHSAAILAKRAATLDALSGGRLRLGVGIGWQKEEYEAIGVPFRDRGRRLDECIEAMRALWREEWASYDGRHVRFDAMSCDPKPHGGAGVPIVIGGSSDAAARRAGRLGDGYLPFAIDAEGLRAKLRLVREAARAAERDPDEIELTAWPGIVDPSSSFDPEVVRRYVELGADRLIVSAVETSARSLDEIRRVLERYLDEVVARL